MSDELEKFLKENTNPWKKIQEPYYILEDEKEAAQNKQYKIHTELPPQPFQGNPEAPIWVLSLNPGYSEKTDKYPVPDVEYYKNHEERKKAMLLQLTFSQPAENNHWHYVLDNEDGNYSKKWFMDHFIKNRDMGLDIGNIDKNIFILQAFGYASDTFNGNLNKMVKSFPHMVYAQNLARWGLAHDRKIVIARCKDYWLDILRKSEYFSEKKENIYFLSSPQNISFSAENIVNWNEYQQIKKKSADGLKKIIKNK